MTVARITVLLNLDNAQAGAGDMIDAHELAEWAIDDAFSARFGEDPRVTGWRIVGDWPETEDIFTMSDPLGAP